MDIEREVHLQLAKPEIASRIGKGKRIVVGVGSRGVACIDRIVPAVIKEGLKKEDAEAIGALFGKNKEEGVEIAKKAMAGKKK